MSYTPLVFHIFLAPHTNGVRAESELEELSLVHIYAVHTLDVCQLRFFGCVSDFSETLHVHNNIAPRSAKSLFSQRTAAAIWPSIKARFLRGKFLENSVNPRPGAETRFRQNAVWWLCIADLCRNTMGTWGYWTIQWTPKICSPLCALSTYLARATCCRRSVGFANRIIEVDLFNSRANCAPTARCL